MLSKYYFMQRGDFRKKEQTNRLNLHVRVCEDDYQHVQIEYVCPFNLSNVAPLHKIILGLLKIFGDRYINSLFITGAIFFIIIIILITFSFHEVFTEIIYAIGVSMHCMPNYNS